MRLIDPTKTVTTRETTENGLVDRREHFNGSVDATVHIRALRLNLVADAPPRKAVVAAVAELEAAQAAWILAKHSGDPAFVTSAKRRLLDANERMVEAQ